MTVHEYYVDIDEAGDVQTYSVDVSDQNHHTRFKDVQDFFSFLSSLLHVSEVSIKSFKWIGRR